MERQMSGKYKKFEGKCDSMKTNWEDAVEEWKKDRYDQHNPCKALAQIVKGYFQK